MAFNSVTFRVELDPLVKKELDHDFFVLEEWQSAEHKDNGTHGAITADSVAIAGDLTVLGFTGIANLSSDVILASEITTDLLTVNTTLVLPGAGPNIIDSTNCVLLDQTNFKFGNILNISSGGIVAIGPIDVNAESTDTSGNAPLRLKNEDDTVNNWIEMSFYGGDNTGPDPLPVEVGRFGMQVKSHGVVPLADFVWKNETAEIMRLNNGGDLLITNKFTVDGSTGNTALAGTFAVATTSFTASTAGALTAAGANAGLTLASQTGAGASWTIFNTAALYSLYGGGAGSQFTLTAAGEATLTGGIHSDGTTFNVDATNNRVGIGTASPSEQLHTTGVVRFQNYAGGFLEADANGVLSANVNVLENNGVNFGPGLPTSVTVVGGQITAIS